MAGRSAALVYLVLDVSGSMWMRDPDNPNQSRVALEETPWAVARDGLPRLWYELRKSPQARHLVHLRIVEFGEKPRDLLPLTRVEDVARFDKLGQQVQTNYQAVFEHLGKHLVADIATLAEQCQELRQPLVYFITDGRPWVSGHSQALNDWKPALDRLHAIETPASTRRVVARADGTSRQPDTGHRPAVVALGLGDAEAEALKIIARHPGVAGIAQDDATPAALLSEVLDAVLNSILNSTGGRFEIDLPAHVAALT